MLFPAIFINVIQLTTKSLYFWDSLYSMSGLTLKMRGWAGLLEIFFRKSFLFPNLMGNKL